jgi:hypothetical protein
MGTGGSFPGGEADHSPPASAEVRKMWVYASTPHAIPCTGKTLPFTYCNPHLPRFVLASFRFQLYVIAWFVIIYCGPPPSESFCTSKWPSRVGTASLWRNKGRYVYEVFLAISRTFCLVTCSHCHCAGKHRRAMCADRPVTTPPRGTFAVHCPPQGSMAFICLFHYLRYLSVVFVHSSPPPPLPYTL